MITDERDRTEILRLHKDWWEANAGLDIPRMQSVFPSGMSYLMFNMNGHPYFGIKEKTDLWRWYIQEIEIATMDVRIMRLSITGDAAWLACEAAVPMRVVGASGTGSDTWQVSETEQFDQFRCRATEIYQRDDGDGNPVWKMWHFHGSPLPPEDEERPGIGDVAADRGLGGIPDGDPLRVVGV